MSPANVTGPSDFHNFFRDTYSSKFIKIYCLGEIHYFRGFDGDVLRFMEFLKSHVVMNDLLCLGIKHG